MKTVDILGVQIDNVAAPEALVRLRGGLEAGKRQYVVTVNPEIIMRAQHDLAYKEILNKADLRIPDGMGTVWAAKYLQISLRGPLPGLRAYVQAGRTLVSLLLFPKRVKTIITDTVPGSDFTVDIAGMCEEFGYNMYLLGSGEGVAQAAADTLSQGFPSLNVVGAAPGSAKESDDESMRSVIEMSKAQVILVAYGAPKQEQWMVRNVPHLSKPVLAIGVGGTFDSLVGAASVEGGRVAKAPPAFVRQRGLEWLWRLVRQPHRRGRIMTALPVFVHHVVKYKKEHHTSTNR